MSTGHLRVEYEDGGVMVLIGRPERVTDGVLTVVTVDGDVLRYDTKPIRHWAYTPAGGAS